MFGDQLESISSQLKKAKKAKISNTTRSEEKPFNDLQIKKEKEVQNKKESEIRYEEFQTNETENYTKDKEYKNHNLQTKTTETLYSDVQINRQAQKRKFYPERKFDKLEHKHARLRPGDVSVLKAFADDSAEIRKRIPSHLKTEQRLRDNDIIRVLVSCFVDEIENKKNIDFSKVQTEQQLKEFILEVMS